jgi:hypothetical protein
MAKQNRLADARGGSDVLGFGPSESLPRENVDRDLQQLPAAILTLHAGLADRRGQTSPGWTGRAAGGRIHK